MLLSFTRNNQQVMDFKFAQYSLLVIEALSFLSIIFRK